MEFIQNFLVAIGASSVVGSIGLLLLSRWINKKLDYAEAAKKIRDEYEKQHQSEVNILRDAMYDVLKAQYYGCVRADKELAPPWWNSELDHSFVALTEAYNALVKLDNKHLQDLRKQK